jgi:inner membrane protein
LANRHLGWQGISLYAGAGYASHLLADTLTKAGVRWFMPAWNFSFKLPLIRTGSASGNMMEVAICVGYGLLVLGLVLGQMQF